LKQRRQPIFSLNGREVILLCNSGQFEGNGHEDAARLGRLACEICRLPIKFTGYTQGMPHIGEGITIHGCPVLVLTKE
jgi:hypothetical protein